MSAATRFVVKRLRWMPRHDDVLVRLPGEVAVASFPTFDEAAAERDRREEEARARVNPFACGGGGTDEDGDTTTAVHYWTHLDEPRLRDWLMDHGVDPPKPNKKGTTDWVKWWKRRHKKMSAEKRAAVWEALDKVRFYTVGEEPARPVAYAVVRVNWQYNDQFFYAGREGGSIEQVLYRSREKAEEECAECNYIAADAWKYNLTEVGYEEGSNPENSLEAFSTIERIHLREGRLKYRATRADRAARLGGFWSTEGVPFYEVVEVELEGFE